MFKFPDAVHPHDWLALAAVGFATVCVSYVTGFAAPDASRFAFIIVPVVLLVAASAANARGVEQGSVAIATGLAWIFCALLSLAYSCYAFTALSLPLQDEALYAFDRAIGIDLVAFRVAVGQSKWMSDTLIFVYVMTALQMKIGLIAVFLIRDNYCHLRKCISVYTIGVVASSIIMALIPALGAYPYLQMETVDSGFLARAGTERYVDHYLSLRDGTMREFPLTDWKGIVTFPSFHTFASMVAAYAVRPIRWLFWPFVVFTTLVAISTLPVGGHYTIDVLGGALMFAAGVAWVERRDRDFARTRAEQAVPFGQAAPAPV
jgi:membrane-associated phospholipid phosphatase